MNGDTLKARLQERLAATGKKPVPLARAIGRGRDYLTDILNGKKDSLSSDTLTPLARELKCDERYFTDENFTSPGSPRKVSSEAMIEHYATKGREVQNFVNAWRDWVGLSKEELAAETGLSPARLVDIEDGNVTPSPEDLAKIADALHTTLGFLLDQNPYETDRRIARLASITEALDGRDQEALLDMAETLKRRRADAA